MAVSEDTKGLATWLEGPRTSLLRGAIRGAFTTRAAGVAGHSSASPATSSSSSSCSSSSGWGPRKPDRGLGIRAFSAAVAPPLVRVAEVPSCCVKANAKAEVAEIVEELFPRGDEECEDELFDSVRLDAVPEELRSAQTPSLRPAAPLAANPPLYHVIRPSDLRWQPSDFGSASRAWVFRQVVDKKLADPPEILRAAEALCQMQGALFVDPDFKVFTNHRVTMWLRPEELGRHDGGPVSLVDAALSGGVYAATGVNAWQQLLSELGAGCGAPRVSDWQLFRGTPRAHDVLQGELGDCWFLSSLAALAEFQGGRFVRALFPGQEHASPHGAYLVRLCLGGCWRNVLIDDRLPSAGGGRYYTQLVYCVTRRLQLWASLIEKAFAKACGSYEAIVGGEAGEALSVLTGWPCTLIRFDHEDFDAEILWATLCSSRDAAFLMTCSTGRVADEEPKLVPFHVYSLIDVSEVHLDEGCVKRVLKIRNPHEKTRWQRVAEAPHWVPCFMQPLLAVASDEKSKSTDLFTSNESGTRSIPAGIYPDAADVASGECLETDDRGAFQLEFQDFLRRFAHCTICRIRSHEWHEERASLRIPRGEVPCSGLRFKVCEATALTDCSVSLVQPEERVRRGPLFEAEHLGPLACIGFILLRLNVGTGEVEETVATTDVRCQAAVSADVWLLPGALYLLVPLSLHNGAPVRATCVCVSSRQVAVEDHCLDWHTIRTAWAAYARSHDPIGGEHFHGAVLHMGKGEGGSFVALIDNRGEGFLNVELFVQSECMRYSRGQGSTGDWLAPGSAQILQVGLPGDGSGGAVSWHSQHRFHMQGRSPETSTWTHSSWHDPPLTVSAADTRLERPDADRDSLHVPFRLSI